MSLLVRTVQYGMRARETDCSAQIQSVFWKGRSFNPARRHTSLTFPRLQECPAVSRQVEEESQGRGPLSWLPSPLLFTLSPIITRELPPRLPGSTPGYGLDQRTVTRSGSDNITGSALGYIFSPADRVGVPMGLTFN